MKGQRGSACGVICNGRESVCWSVIWQSSLYSRTTSWYKKRLQVAKLNMVIFCAYSHRGIQLSLFNTKLKTTSNLIWKDQYPREFSCSEIECSHCPFSSPLWSVIKELAPPTLITIRWKTAGPQSWVNRRQKECEAGVGYVGDPSEESGLRWQ